MDISVSTKQVVQEYNAAVRATEQLAASTGGLAAQIDKVESGAVSAGAAVKDAGRQAVTAAGELRQAARSAREQASAYEAAAKEAQKLAREQDEVARIATANAKTLKGTAQQQAQAEAVLHRERARQLREQAHGYREAARVQKQSAREVELRLREQERAIRANQYGWISLAFVMQDVTMFEQGLAQGMRATLNNLIPLAAMLGVGGPLLAGFTALAIGAQIFGDDIQEALKVKGVASVESLKSALDELIEVKVDAFDVKYQVENLDDLRKAMAGLDEATKNLTADGATGSGFIRWLAETQLGLLQNMPLLAGYLNQLGLLRSLTAVDVGKSNIVAALQEQAEALGATEEQIKALEILKPILDELGLNKVAGDADLLTESMTKLNKEISDSQTMWSALGTQWGLEYAELSKLNDELEDAVEVRERLNRVRIENAGALAGPMARFGGDSTSLGVEMASLGEFAPLDWNQVKLHRGGKPLWQILRGPGMTQSQADALERRFTRELNEDLRETDRVLRSLQETVEGGLADGLSSLAAALGEVGVGVKDFSQIGASVMGALAEIAIRTGKVAVAEGIAIESIKEALRTLNGPVAIAAGFALIGLGAAVKAKLADIGNDMGGESGYAGGTPGYIGAAPATPRAIGGGGLDLDYDRLARAMAQSTQPIVDAVNSTVPVVFVEQADTALGRYQQKKAELV